VLEPAEARQLGLPPQRAPGAPADNQHVKQVLVALTQLARAARHLFLLCFDQVDNLDEEQVRALTRFLHDLLDSAGNLLIVTTGVQQTMLDYQRRGVITETSWDRVGQFKVPLGRLRREQVWELLRARLGAFLKPFRGLPEVEQKVRTDALFPLGSAWFEERLRDLIEVRPRDAIDWAGERWERLQDALAEMSGREWLQRWPEEPTDLRGAVITEAVLRALTDQRGRALRDLEQISPGRGRLLKLLTRLLGRCEGGPYRLHAWHPVPGKPGARTYDLMIEQRCPPEGDIQQVGVRVLVGGHGNTVTAALTRFMEDSQPPRTIVLVSDARAPLRMGARGKELLDELGGRNAPAFRHCELDRYRLAELEALEAVAAQARDEDLTVEFPPGQRRVITEEAALAALHREGRYLAHPLLRELLGGDDSAGEEQPPTPAAGDAQIRESAPAPS
jgi:hypothetical protein